MKKKFYLLALITLFSLSLLGCSSGDEPGSVVGVWRTPALAGQSEGFIYELTENGTIRSSYDGVLYVGGTYEVKGDNITLKDYPTAHIESAGSYDVTIVNYGNEAEKSFEVSGDELRITDANGTVVWTRAASVIPTPKPTPTPPPAPTLPPEPEPELESIEVLHYGESLPFVTEFSLKAGTTDNHFSVDVQPEGMDVEILIESDNEEIFTIERIDLGGLPNAFEVTAVAPGNATLVVTAEDIVERYTVRVTE